MTDSDKAELAAFKTEHRQHTDGFHMIYDHTGWPLRAYCGVVGCDGKWESEREKRYHTVVECLYGCGVEFSFGKRWQHHCTVTGGYPYGDSYFAAVKALHN